MQVNFSYIAIPSNCYVLEAHICLYVQKEFITTMTEVLILLTKLDYKINFFKGRPTG